MNTILALQQLGYENITDFEVRWTGSAQEIAVWNHTDAQPDQSTLDAAWATFVSENPVDLPDSAALNVAEIKRAATQVILDHFPEWKQRNYLARGVELTNKVATGGTLTAEETTEAADLQAQWDWVKQVRDTSDTAEAANTIASTITWPAAP